MQKRLLSVALTTAFLGGCGTVAKESTPILGDIKSNKGHVSDSSGNVIKSGNGECVYNGNWSKDSIINVCEGIEDKEMEPVAAPKPVEEPEAAPVEAEEKTPVVETVILNSRALFSTDADALSEKGDQLMRNLIAKLGDFSQIEKVEIVGHTDDRGSEEYNLVLSERRAETIKGFLVGEYSDAKISTVGMGEAEPKASNDSAEGRQQNRRVEIRVTAKKIVKPAE